MNALLRRFLPGQDTALPLRDDGSAITAVILEADGFQSIEEPVPIDAERGISGRFGITEDGREVLVELSFDKGVGWNQRQVQSWLARNGLDAAEGGRVMDPDQVHLQVGSDRTKKLVAADRDDAWTRGHDDAKRMSTLVEETDDYWVIKDNVITRNGVFNGTYRPADMLRDSFQLYEGIPVTHQHPQDIVRSLDDVAGIMRNVRLDDLEDGGVRVLADMWLPKHTGVQGLKTSQDLVDLNEETVRRTREGLGVDNSQGFLHRARQETGVWGDREYRAVVQALVPNHNAILLDNVGACNWEDGCGVARTGGDAKHGKGHMDPKDMGGAMGNECDGKCATRDQKIDDLASERDAFAEAGKAILDAAGIEADEVTPATLKGAATTIQTDHEDLQHFRKEEKQAHDELVDKVVKMAAVDKDTGKPLEGEALEKVRDHYGSMPSAALIEIHTALDAAKKATAEQDRRGPVLDTARIGSDGKTKSVRTPGKPVMGSDGKWRYPTQEDN